MANCQYCSKTLSNNKQIAVKCDNCGTVWCADGQCTGSSGKKQSGRNNGSRCSVCQKDKTIRLL